MVNPTVPADNIIDSNVEKDNDTIINVILNTSSSSHSPHPCSQRPWRATCQSSPQSCMGSDGSVRAETTFVGGALEPALEWV